MVSPVSQPCFFKFHKFFPLFLCIFRSFLRNRFMPLCIFVLCSIYYRLIFFGLPVYYCRELCKYCVMFFVLIDFFVYSAPKRGHLHEIYFGNMNSIFIQLLSIFYFAVAFCPICWYNPIFNSWEMKKSLCPLVSLGFSDFWRRFKL